GHSVRYIGKGSAECGASRNVRATQQPLAATCRFCYLIGSRDNEFLSTLPSLWRRASSRDFSHNRVAIRTRSARSLDEIIRNRADHRRRTLSYASGELLRLRKFGAAIRRRQLGASPAASTLRLGNGCNYHRNVDKPAELVLGRL